MSIDSTRDTPPSSTLYSTHFSAHASKCLKVGWVSPFGHRGISVCCRLPRAFRRLPRPSSPLTAKASTVDAYSLDHITRSRLLKSYAKTRLIASTTHLNSIRSLDACYVPNCQRTRPDLNVWPLQILLCALIYPKLVELTGIEPVTPCLQSRCSPS